MVIDDLKSSQEVCKIYCAWLNSFEADDDPYRYTEKDFMYDPSNGRYGDWTLNAIIPQTNGTVEVHNVTFGDEGGPQTLIVFRDELRDGAIDMILQAFDTGYTVVFKDPTCEFTRGDGPFDGNGLATA